MNVHEEKAMGLLGGEQRVLEVIETELRAVEPQLVSKFSIFARLTVGEPKPAAEVLAPPRWYQAFRYYGRRRMPSRIRRVALLSAGMLVLVMALVVGARSVGGVCHPTAQLPSATAKTSQMPTSCPWMARPGAAPWNGGR